MKQDWETFVQNEIDDIFELTPNINDVPELSELINILNHIQNGECQCQGELISRIKSDLKGAEQWLVDYHTMGDRNTIQAAVDRKSHAEYLLNTANEQGIDVAHYQRWLENLNSRISQL